MAKDSTDEGRYRLYVCVTMTHDQAEVIRFVCIVLALGGLAGVLDAVMMLRKGKAK